MKPWPRWLPAVIFGAFLVLSVVELAIGLARGGHAAAHADVAPAAVEAELPGGSH
jgi:hypothetical protein